MVLEKKTSRKQGKGKKVVLIVTLLVWLAATGFLAYSYLENRKDMRNLRAQLDTANKQLEPYKDELELQEHITAVSKLYDVPNDERPHPVLVADKSKIKDQPFFNKAENGDIALIYPESQLAILYRPSTKQIVNVNSVTIQKDDRSDD